MRKGYRQLLEEAAAAVTTLEPAEAARLVADEGALLVDLRDPREVERDGRIPGAKHCPRGMLEFW
ncbi:rhodanese-like domain-containing protein, partial [Escherichia coli]